MQTCEDERKEMGDRTIDKEEQFALEGLLALFRAGNESAPRERETLPLAFSPSPCPVLAFLPRKAEDPERIENPCDRSTCGGVARYISGSFPDLLNCLICEEYNHTCFNFTCSELAESACSRFSDSAASHEMEQAGRVD